MPLWFFCSLASQRYSDLKGELEPASSQRLQHLRASLLRACCRLAFILICGIAWRCSRTSARSRKPRVAAGSTERRRNPATLLEKSPVPSPRGHRCLPPLSPVRLPPALSFLPSEGGKEKEEQPYEKNVNLLITEYIAVHLKCCCYANTLGVYFLNPGVKRLVPRSPAELFEYVAAAAVSV